MRTTLNIPDRLIQDLEKVTGEKSKTKAICIAIEDFIKKRELEKLLSLKGKLNIKDKTRELEDLELKEVMENAKRRRSRSLYKD